MSPFVGNVTIRLSGTVFEIQRVIRRKSQILPSQRISDAPVGGNSIRTLARFFRRQKRRFPWPSCGVVCVTIIQHASDRDKHTGRHRTIAYTALA